MSGPWIRLTSSGRGLEAGNWVFDVSAEEVTNAPTVVKWTEVVHPIFSAERAAQDRKLPSRLRLIVRFDGSPDQVIADAVLRMDVMWQNAEWIVCAPLGARFDQHGHPDIELGDCTAEPAVLPPDEVRTRVLRVLDSDPDGFMIASTIASRLEMPAKELFYNLEVLGGEGCVELQRAGGGEGNATVLITARGRRRARGDEPKPRPETNVTIGAIIGSMSGGNVQAVGTATDSEISQVANDPEMLRSALDALCSQIVEAVKAELQLKDLGNYIDAAEALNAELLKPKADASIVKRAIKTLAFLGDVEGTVGLMVRVWPQVSSLLLMAETLLKTQ